MYVFTQRPLPKSRDELKTLFLQSKRPLYAKHPLTPMDVLQTIDTMTKTDAKFRWWIRTPFSVLGVAILSGMGVGLLGLLGVAKLCGADTDEEEFPRHKWSLEDLRHAFSGVFEPRVTEDRLKDKIKRNTQENQTGYSELRWLHENNLVRQASLLDEACHLTKLGKKFLGMNRRFKQMNLKLSSQQ